MYLSLHPRLTKTLNANPGAVVQLVRMPACHAGGRGFEPLPHRKTLKSRRHESATFSFCGADPRFGFIEGRNPSNSPTRQEPSTSAILFHIRLFQTSQFLGQREHFWRLLRPSPEWMTGTSAVSAVFAPVPQAEGRDAHVFGGFCASPPGGWQGCARFGRFLCSSPRRMAGMRTFWAVFAPVVPDFWTAGAFGVVFAPVPRADGGPSDRTGNNRPARRADS